MVTFVGPLLRDPLIMLSKIGCNDILFKCNTMSFTCNNSFFICKDVSFNCNDSFFNCNDMSLNIITWLTIATPTPSNIR